MAVCAEVPHQTLLTYHSFLDREESEAQQEAPRFWGMQVVIFDQEDRVFLRRDPDGHKLEGHLGGGEVFFPNTRPLRFNGVSGGAALAEDPLEVARREMEEELGDHFFGSGRFTFHEDVPVFVCYQEESKQARLLGGLLVTYQAVSQEVERLENIGRFWPLDSVYRRVSPRSANDLFRPAFRVGIWILYQRKQGSAIEEFVREINDAMVERAQYRAEERGIPLDLGVFAEQEHGSFAEAA